MVSLLTPRLQAILCAFVLFTLSTASPAPRATNSAVPLPIPPAGSKVVFVDSSDPGIVWSPEWQTVPSSCSSGNIRAVSGNAFDFSTITATYSFRGTGVYANIQSSDSLFQFEVDGTSTYFSSSVPSPANCSYDWSKTGLEADIDHVFMIQALGPSVSLDAYWTLALGSLAIIQPDAGSGSGPSASGPTTAQPPSPSGSSASASGSGNSPGASGGAAGSGGGLKSTDIIAIVTSIIGGVAGIFGIIAGIYQFRKWQKKRSEPPARANGDFLLREVKEPLMHT